MIATAELTSIDTAPTGEPAGTTLILPSPAPAPVASAPREERRESLSPFVAWSQEDLAPLPGELMGQGGPSSLLVDLVRDPRALAIRLLDGLSRERMVLATLALLASCIAVFATAVMVGRGHGGALRASLLVPLNALIAVAAAVAPIHAAGILLAARLPVGRLVATLLAAETSGALLLAALAPFEYVAWRTDFQLGGPRALLWAFLVAAAVIAAQLWRVLRAMAEEVVRRTRPEGVGLDASERGRVAVFTRLAALVLGFTSAMSVWLFDAFIWS